MESYDSVLLENEQVGIEQAFLGKNTGTVQNGGTENPTGATLRGVKRPVDNQYREVESTKKETTGAILMLGKTSEILLNRQTTYLGSLA